jgi:hypothetical protein
MTRRRAQAHRIAPASAATIVSGSLRRRAGSPSAADRLQARPPAPRANAAWRCSPAWRMQPHAVVHRRRHRDRGVVARHSVVTRSSAKPWVNPACWRWRARRRSGRPSARVRYAIAASGGFVPKRGAHGKADSAWNVGVPTKRVGLLGHRHLPAPRHRAAATSSAALYAAMPCTHSRMRWSCRRARPSAGTIPYRRNGRLTTRTHGIA